MSIQSQINQYDLEHFFELSPDLLCISGYDGYFKKVNAAVSKTLGYSAEELLTLPIDHFVHPEDRELTWRKREEIRKGNTIFQFENRYLVKDGNIVWLLWTCIPVTKEKLIFAIAKNITHKKKSEENLHVLEILKNLNTAQMKRFSSELEVLKASTTPDQSNLKWMGSHTTLSVKDQVWLNKFEAVVRKFVGSSEINLKALSIEMATSERQLYREVNRIMEITPNKLILIIRLHLAWEAIASGNYRNLADIAKVAGYSSTTHFKKLFQQLYGINVSDLL